MTEEPRNLPRSIPQGDAPGKPGALAIPVLVAVLVASSTVPFAGGAEVKEAPPEVREAEVPEEPDWDRDTILRQVREEERRAAARAVEAAREEVRRGMERALADALAENERLRGGAGEAGRREERLAAALESARAEIDSLRSAGEEERGNSADLRGELERMRYDLAGAEAALAEAGRREEDLRDRLAGLQETLDGQESKLASLEGLRRSLEEERLMAAAVREERDAALGRAHEAETALEAVGAEKADADARHAREVRDLRAALSEARDLPPLEQMCASMRSESYRRGLEEGEAQRDAALLRLEEARSETARLLASYQRQGSELAALRTDVQIARREAASPDCSAPVEAAGRRAREEAEEACRRQLARAASDREAPDRSAEMRASLTEATERAAHLEKELQDSEREVARLSSALARAEQSAPRQPRGRKSDRAVEREVRRRLAQAMADERLLAETDRDLAVAEAESGAAERMARFFAEVRGEWEARAARLEQEERERSEAAFARALQAVSSGTERERARGIWEETR